MIRSVAVEDATTAFGTRPGVGQRSGHPADSRADRWVGPVHRAACVGLPPGKSRTFLGVWFVTEAVQTASPGSGIDDGLTTEDLSRSRDRQRVVAARSKGRRTTLLWLLVGPGVLAMLGENDGPSMLSYAASGAQYGIGFFLPFIAVTFLAAYVVQEMAMRLGAVTHRGYGELIFQRFGPFWGWLSAGDLVVTNLITLITEVIAIRTGMAYFGIPPLVAVACAVLLVAVSTSGGRYWRWERLAMGLALFNLVFLVAVAFMVHPSPGADRQRQLLTWTPLPGGDVAGVPADPGVQYRGDGDAVDAVLPAERVGRQGNDAEATSRSGRLDTGLGTGAGGGGGLCDRGGDGATLRPLHVDMSQFGRAEPGSRRRWRQFDQSHPVAALFALGLIEAGAAAMLTISASTAYAVGEVAGRGGA